MSKTVQNVTVDRMDLKSFSWPWLLVSILLMCGVGSIIGAAFYVAWGLIVYILSSITGISFNNQDLWRDSVIILLIPCAYIVILANKIAKAEGDDWIRKLIMNIILIPPVVIAILLKGFMLGYEQTHHSPLSPYDFLPKISLRQLLV
jgi:ABC-type Fe3+ transport system permease subunit